MMMLLTMPREEEDDPCSVAISASRITGLTVGSAVASRQSHHILFYDLHILAGTALTV